MRSIWPHKSEKQILYDSNRWLQPIYQSIYFEEKILSLPSNDLNTIDCDKLNWPSAFEAVVSIDKKYEDKESFDFYRIGFNRGINIAFEEQSHVHTAFVMNATLTSLHIFCPNSMKNLNIYATKVSTCLRSSVIDWKDIIQSQYLVDQEGVKKFKV